MFQEGELSLLSVLCVILPCPKDSLHSFEWIGTCALQGGPWVGPQFH
jgi:hypothetical protein